MLVTDQTYQRLALEDPDGLWELHRGRAREKPAMAFEHNRAISRLARQLFRQLDESEYDVRVNRARVSRSDDAVYIPDLIVLPIALTELYELRRGALEIYDAPLPLVVEVWSPSTGGYDIDAKIPTYRHREDHEVWRLHPSGPSLRVWRRQPDGTNAESVHHAGTIQPAFLPRVTIDLDALFA